MTDANTNAAPPRIPGDDELAGLPALAPLLADRLRELGYSVEGIRGAIGDAGLAAMDRGEPEAVAVLADRADRANDGDRAYRSPVTDLIRSFIIGDPADLAPHLGDGLLRGCLSAGVLREIRGGEGAGGGGPVGHVAAIDVRPVVVDGIERIVFSDRDASMTDHVPGPDHVLGVGRASRSLLDVTPTDPVGSVLDLGCGCGVQALGQHRTGSVTATDVHPRALVFAEATLAAAAGAGTPFPDTEVLRGSWFEPVRGRRFDRVVANPPFVVGLPEVGHVYRDSGLDLDGATELMLSSVADHLNPGGTAHLLGAWAHVDGGDWASRIASWLPKEGLEVWVVQRDVAAPDEYVGTWLRDESIDPRSAEGRDKTRRWLDHFAAAGVTGIGFGYVTVQAIDGPTSVTCEDMLQPLGGPFRDEAAEYLLRAEWLRERSAEDILAARFRVRPGVAVERVGLADAEEGQGFNPAALRLTRTDGPRWSHDTDESVVRILSALHPEAPLGTAIDVMEMLGAIPEGGAAEVKSAVVPVIVDLVRHGLVLPEDLLADG